MSVPQLRLGTRRALWAYTFLFVPLLFYIAIRLGPAFSSLYISLHEWNLISPSKPFVGLQNFRLLTHDPRFVQAAVKDRKSTRLNSSHSQISYAVFCLKKK